MKKSLLSAKVETKLNELIGQELKAMYHYVAAANWCQENGYLRAYDFFLGESADEKLHSEILQKYMLDMGACPELDDIETPEMDYECLNCVIEAAFEMETDLGMMYSKFASELTSSDFMTLTKVQEFIKFQTESIGFYGDVCAAGEGLSKDKFQQLMLEKILVKKNAG
jgi:ferritin